MTENAKMKIKSFDQEAFTSNGKSMKDFQEELSPSRVLVDLEVGSLVVQTKKLSKKSILKFPVRSERPAYGEPNSRWDSMPRRHRVGRTESTVAFTPVGNDRPYRFPPETGFRSVRAGWPPRVP